MSIVVKVKSLEKSFSIPGGDKIEVLKGIDLEIKSGEFISIMGPSGSGKSTLLNILASVEVATNGSVVISDFVLSKGKESLLTTVRRNITSIVYQDFNLLEYLTAAENVMVPMMLKGTKNEKILKKKVYDLLQKLGIQDVADQIPDELSGGQRQRVAVARALANDPKVILADEPTGNLDTKIGDSIMNIFRGLAEEGITVIMVTHNIQHARKTDKIYVLREGKLFLEEKIKEEEL